MRLRRQMKRAGSTEQFGVLPRLRSRRLRSAAAIGALALTLGTVAVTTVVLSPQSAQAAPGTPGVPQAGGVLYQEDFQNGSGVTPLTSYASSSGATYTADPYWLDNRHCNGFILSFNDAPRSTDCDNYNPPPNSQPQEYSAVKAKAYALGLLSNPGDPASNRALSTNTTGGDGTAGVGGITPNQIEFETSQLSLPSASGRYITFAVDAAATDCSPGQPPLLRFYIRNAAGQESPISSSAINPCTDPGHQDTTVPVTTDGQSFNYAVSYGRFAANGSVLVSNSSTFGIVLRNESDTAGNGNDGAIDNIRILDATPQLDKSFSPAIAATGGTSTLTFTVTNTSDLAAKSGWSFTDALPSGLTVASGALGGTCNATTTAAAGGTSIAVTNGVLTAGEASCTVTVPVTSATTGSYTNGPDNVTGTGLNPPGNATVAFESPALTLVKHAGTPVDVNGNGITDVGDTIQYTFDVTNTGDVPITDVAVNDSKAGHVTCASTTLAVGASETCSADSVYAITSTDAANGSVNNTATATGTSPAGATVTSPQSSTSTPATTAAPGLTVVKSADPSDAASYTPGQVITYHFTVTNTGNVTMNNVGIDEGAFNGSNAISQAACPTTTLAAGAQVVCTATYTLTSTDVDQGSITNTANAHGTPQGSNNPILSPPSSVTVPTPAAPGITVVKSANPTTVTTAGQPVTYSFVVTNTGNVTLKNVKVNDTAFSGSNPFPTVDCPTTTLVAGQVETCTATYTVTQADVDAGTLTNTANVIGTPPSGTPLDPVPSNPVTVNIPASPALSIVKTADVQAGAVGEKITYTFTVTNTGNVTITDPQVADTGFTGHGTLSAIVCPTGPITLAPGQVETCTATYTVVQADIDAGSISNAATVTGTPPHGDPIPPVPSQPVNITTNPHAALSLVKTASSQQATTVGQVITYTFAVTNTGNVDITNPTVKEGTFTGHGTLSAVKCPSGNTLAPGQELDCTATYTVVAADLTGGTLSNTATVTGTTPAGDPITSDPSTAKVTEVAPPAAAGLASTGSDIWTVGLVGLGLLVLGLLATAAVWLQRRRTTPDSNS